VPPLAKRGEIGRGRNKHSLRDISTQLEAQGYLNERGKPFNPKSIPSMLGSCHEGSGKAAEDDRRGGAGAKGLTISHEGVAGVLRARSAS
jgi:hypothetical protein